MPKSRVSNFLRVLSYAPMVLVIGWNALRSARPRGPACPGMSCMANGLGEALLLMAAVFAAVIVGAIFNIASFMLKESPRTALRKWELWLLFVTPLVLALGSITPLIVRKLTL